MESLSQPRRQDRPKALVMEKSIFHKNKNIDKILRGAHYFTRYLSELEDDCSDSDADLQNWNLIFDILFSNQKDLNFVKKEPFLNQENFSSL
ncbi:unnamed protein product [Moneuplotes crassus]|uniref:Uncharacterized protein n=1 Tax=Euplotes crassus TaxID=5936 RepID=A0AAD1U4A1_EUPCR|nr:unnamed protein product [Moneuplotes crassus]